MQPALKALETEPQEILNKRHDTGKTAPLPSAVRCGFDKGSKNVSREREAKNPDGL